MTGSQFEKWSLEAVVQQIAEMEPTSTVLAVQPDRMEHGSFACYDSFVESDGLGSPNYDLTANGKAALHLEKLFQKIDET